MNAIAEVITTEMTQEANKAEAFFNLAQAYTVEDEITAEAAADDLKQCKVIYKTLEEMRKTAKEPFLKKGKEVDAYFKEPLEFLTKAEGILKKSLLAYQQKMQALRLEAQRRAEAEAAAERAKIEAKMQQAIESAKASGDVVTAAALEATPVVMPAVAAPTVEAPKLDGIATKTTWECEVTDLKALLQSIIDGKCSDTVIEIKQGELNKLARALNTSMNIPGLKAVQKQTLSARVA